MNSDIEDAVDALVFDSSGDEWEHEKANKFSPIGKAQNILNPSRKHLDVLQNYFGHSQFRPMQWEIIYSIIEEHRDSCVVMATGYGKSLCYQYPAVYSEGLTLVVTPLISLMEDQTLSLQVANINACYLGSAQTSKHKVVSGILNGEYRVVYVTPEFCTGESGQNLLSQIANTLQITLVAIDEAHCVSQWGHDFRHCYRKLGSLRSVVGNVPFLAVTATATPEVRRDICASLKLRNPRNICTGFDRPNLYFAVDQKGINIFKDIRRHMVSVKGILEFEGPTIIYCQTKKMTEHVAGVLQSHAVSCEFYNAGLNTQKRKDVHQKFVKDKIQVIVATIAFGMGIDKPDVRCVIHYGAPRDIESYYQEVGRAGRDGLPSHCHCYFTSADFALNNHFASGLIGKARDHRKNMIHKMEQFLYSRQCRRRLLLSHFENDKNKEDAADKNLNDLCCDNCTKRFLSGNKQVVDVLDSDGTYDFAADAQLLLGAVDVFEGRFGLQVPILFLRGSKMKKIKSHLFTHKLFGQGKNHEEIWWKAFGKMMTNEGYLEENADNFFNKNRPGHFPIYTFQISSLGRGFLKKVLKKSDTTLKLTPSAELLSLMQTKRHQGNTVSTSTSSGSVILPLFSVNAWQSPKHLLTLSQKTGSEASQNSQSTVSKAEQEAQGELYAVLLKLRNELANENGCMPYMVASNKALLQLAQLRPSHQSQLTTVDGFMGAKIDKFGRPIIHKIREFCEAHNLPLGMISQVAEEARKSEDEAGLEFLPHSIKTSFILFHREGLDVPTVASQRQLQPSTIIQHLCEAIKVGLPLNVLRLGVSMDIQDTILRAIRAPPVNSNISRLSVIKQNCPDHITWDQLKVTVALLAHMHDLKSDLTQDSQIQDIQQFKYSGHTKQLASNRITTSTTCAQSSQNSPDHQNVTSATGIHNALQRFSYNTRKKEDVSTLPLNGSECDSIGLSKNMAIDSQSNPNSQCLRHDNGLFVNDKCVSNNMAVKQVVEDNNAEWLDSNQVDSLHEQDIKTNLSPIRKKQKTKTFNSASNIWEDDNLFENLDLDGILQDSVKSMEGQRKDEMNQFENVESCSALYRRGEVSHSQTNITNTNNQNVQSNSQDLQHSPVLHNRKLPKWLLQSDAKKTLKCKIKANSLFKM